MNMTDLVEVNHQVNHDVTYTPDIIQYGEIDYWEDAGITGKGDCEDYVLAKRRWLRDRGWPKESLNMAICLDLTGAGHAVLLAELDGEYWVLDNQSEDVLPFGRVHYDWLERTVGGSFRQWVSMKL